MCFMRQSRIILLRQRRRLSAPMARLAQQQLRSRRRQCPWGGSTSLLWGHWTLRSTKPNGIGRRACARELTESVAEGSVEEPLTDLVATWDTGDAVSRRELLALLLTQWSCSSPSVGGRRPRPKSGRCPLGEI